MSTTEFSAHQAIRDDVTIFALRGTDEWAKARASLLEAHAGLVRHIAHSMVRQLSATIDLDDLVSYGTFGLVDAVERFDPQHGARFATYATHRVRGAIIDGMRNLDGVRETMKFPLPKGLKRSA